MSVAALPQRDHHHAFGLELLAEFGDEPALLRIGEDRSRPGSLPQRYVASGPPLSWSGPYALLERPAEAAERDTAQQALVAAAAGCVGLALFKTNGCRFASAPSTGGAPPLGTSLPPVPSCGTSAAAARSGLFNAREGRQGSRQWKAIPSRPVLAGTTTRVHSSHLPFL